MTRLLESSIQIVACCTIYITSALSFLYLLLLVAISTYFAPLCGSVFGSPPETLNYLNQPKTEKYNFLFVSFTVPRESNQVDNQFGDLKDKYRLVVKQFSFSVLKSYLR